MKLRELLLGLGLTNSDARILGGILAQIEWKLEQGPSGKSAVNEPNER